MHVPIITESNWDCKHSKQPYLPSDMKNKTWGHFENVLERESITCDECKIFCDADINCEGVVCLPGKTDLESCVWVTTKIRQQCDIKESNYSSTCWKNKSGK